MDHGYILEVYLSPNFMYYLQYNPILPAGAHFFSKEPISLARGTPFSNGMQESTIETILRNGLMIV